jgi:hypothetical protein
MFYSRHVTQEKMREINVLQPARDTRRREQNVSFTASHYTRKMREINVLQPARDKKSRAVSYCQLGRSIRYNMR